MSNPIIDYNFGNLPISNPDGSMPAQSVNTTKSDGPGNSLLGNYGKAQNFSGAGYITSQLSIPTALKKIAIRILFKINDQTGNRQVLLSTNGISIYLKKSLSEKEFVLAANATMTPGINILDTDKKIKIGVDQWYLADLVFDTDTWALYVDNKFVSMEVLNKTSRQLTADPKMIIGADRNTLADKFNGAIAALKIYIDDIPAEIENDLDIKRTLPQWFISRKYNQLKNTVNLGVPIGEISFNEQVISFVQEYEHGQISFNEALGNAVEMHGEIYKYYKPLIKRYLGTPVTDELPAKKTGGRKNAFARGAIYWSAQTKAIPVMNNIYLHYEDIGEANSGLGLPIGIEKTITGGSEQQFEHGIIVSSSLLRTTFEISSDFIAAYRAEGGASKIGYPLSGPVNVLNASRQTIGKSCTFEKGVIYFSTASGAHFIPSGRIANAYQQTGGPKGPYKFPTSGQVSVTIKNKTYSCITFQGGAIIDTGSTILYRSSFHLYFGMVKTEESESIVRGENDLYMHLSVKENGVEVVKKRFPGESGYYNENNYENLNYNTKSFVIDKPEKKINFDLDVWEYDPHDDDDYLGIYKKELNINNLWGLTDDPDNVFDSGKVQSIKNINWSIKPDPDPNLPQDFWDITINSGGHRNPKTAEISRDQFAEAFRDIDSEPEWWDIGDWLKKLYMEIGKGVAKDGNCSGFCTEAIYALKGNSPYITPLANYHDWNTVKNIINIKQCYQIGNSSLRWFVHEFIHGHTSDPKRVFTETLACYRRGDNPVLCVAENYFSGGSKHCIMPVEWNMTDNEWTITVFDPNAGPKKSVNKVKINPHNNTYSFYSSELKDQGTHYFGRMTYVPWSLINFRPRTPLLEVLLLLGGLLGAGPLGAAAIFLIIAGSSAKTESLTDIDGNNLDASKETNGNFSGKFLPYCGLEGNNILNGELLTNLPGQINMKDIQHKIKGVNNGDFKYAIKHALNEFGFESKIAAAEVNHVKLEKLGSKDQLVKFASPKNKLVNFITNKNLGNNDKVSVYVKNIPANAGLDLQINTAGGLRHLDILHGATAPSMEITVESRINNVLKKKTYNTNSEGGIRLFLPHALSDESMKTARISSINGTGMDHIFLKEK